MSREVYAWKLGDSSIYLVNVTETDRWYVHAMLGDKVALEDSEVTTIVRSADPRTSRTGMTAMVGWVAMAGKKALVEPLFNLYLDMLTEKDKLDWWKCSACGCESVAVPDEPWLCVWCGEEEPNECE